MKMACIICIILGAAIAVWAQSPAAASYQVTPGRSRVEIQVFRGGLLKALGHDHTITVRNLSGTVRFNPAEIQDSSVSLSIEANSLSVIDPRVSMKERTDVQATMEGPRVLDVRSFPKIIFNSTHIQLLGHRGDNFEINLTGRLNFHGNEREIAFPVHLSLDKNLLHAAGTTSILQTEFGIVPIALGGGTVRVRDQVRVVFDFTAEKPGDR
jgi:polyisoprenoid-binding protein YceI